MATTKVLASLVAGYRSMPEVLVTTSAISSTSRRLSGWAMSTLPGLAARISSISAARKSSCTWHQPCQRIIVSSRPVWRAT